MKENISDLIDPKAYKDPKFKKGLVLKFSEATIRITRVDRKNEKTWGEHIKLVNNNKGFSHYEHHLDSTSDMLKEYGVPYCSDCEIPVSEMANNVGHKKAQDREDARLSDGTIIEDEEQIA